MIQPPKTAALFLLSLVSAALPYATAQAQMAAGKPAVAQPQAAAQQPAANGDPRLEISKKVPGIKPDDLRATPIPNIFEMTRGSEIAYVTTDGKYAISGDLIDLTRKSDLTEARRRDIRIAQIGSIPESDMIVFGPNNPKYTVTVFTDVDCAYCRELHRQMAEYNRLGIRVRYLAYPRTGPNTES